MIIREANFNFFLSNYFSNLSSPRSCVRERWKLLMKNLVCKTDLHNISPVVAAYFFFVCSFANIHEYTFVPADMNLHREEGKKTRRDKIIIISRGFNYVICISARFS